MKRIIVNILVIFIFVAVALTAFAGQAEDEADKILFAAENVFLQMKNKDYRAIWDGLSTKTKNIIVSDVYKASKKMNIAANKDELEKDFGLGGPNAKAYWDSYLQYFDPVLVLEKCKWGMGKIKKDTAEIYVLSKDAERPALLKMYKENNLWKLGLEESFGARKLNPF
ncbi:MAG TPA: hypothetical protein PKW17_10455 [Smithellaceae bacterium]|nr:hypothetical protein [Smithellaceae bacterium]